MRIAGFRQEEGELLQRLRSSSPSVMVPRAGFDGAHFVVVDGRDPVAVAEAALADATDAYRLREWRAALAACDQAERARPGDPSAWTLRGHVHVALDELAQAERAYDVALATTPDHVPALAWRGELRGRRGDVVRGLADARRACQLDPEAEEPRSIRERLERLLELDDMHRQVQRLLDIAPATSRAVVEAPAVRIGDDHAAIERALGPADETGDAMRRGARVTELRWFRQGAMVEVDARGARAVHLFGQPRGLMDALNGDEPLFTPDGRWYRGARWRLQGVTVGETAQAAIDRLGPPDQTDVDANGARQLRWRSRGLTIHVGAEHRVEAFTLEAAGL